MTLKEAWKEAELIDKGMFILVMTLGVLVVMLFICFIIWAFSSIGAGTV